MSEEEKESLGKVQESVSRLRVVGPTGETDSVGSITVINPSGLCITAKHNVEEFLVERICECCGETIPPLNFELDVPVVDDEMFTLKPFEVEVLGVSSFLDLALLKIKRKEDDSPFEFLHLETENPRHASNTYKIGHLHGSGCNLLSSGKMINNGIAVEIANVPSGEVVVFSTAVCGSGDSGGALIGDNFRLRGLLTNSFLNPRGLRDFAKKIAVGKKAFSYSEQAKALSVGISINREVLPTLESVLNKRTINRILDGKEAVLSAREEVKVKSKKW